MIESGNTGTTKTNSKQLIPKLGVAGSELESILILIDRIKNDPNFLPTYEQILNIITKEGKMDLKVLGDIFPNQNEIISKELIIKITDVIETAINVLSKQVNKVSILEVGAGIGRLSLGLNNGLKSRGCKNYKINATDKNTHGLSVLPVEESPYDDAIEQYKPHIILNARMPTNRLCTFKNVSEEDVKERIWTHKFCENENTQLYILFGIPGLSGDPWFVWGQEHYNLKDITTYHGRSSISHLIPYVKKGFQRFPNITPGLNIFNNGFKTIPKRQMSALESINQGYSTISVDNWNKKSGSYYYNRSLSTLFIRNQKIINTLRKEGIL